jgi:hypothetical protein
VVVTGLEVVVLVVVVTGAFVVVVMVVVVVVAIVVVVVVAVVQEARSMETVNNKPNAIQKILFFNVPSFFHLCARIKIVTGMSEGLAVVDAMMQSSQAATQLITRIIMSDNFPIIPPF